MTSQTAISVLPVGEFDTEAVRVEFDAILSVFTTLGASLSMAEPVSDEAQARRFAQTLPPTTDLLLVVPLRGLSAQTIEAAAAACPAPCLLWPVQGRFALPSSTLARGALSDAGRPVEMIYAPPDNARALEQAQCVMRAATAYARVRRSRIGLVGGLFPNLISCRYDAATIHARLGATLVPLAYDELRASLRNEPAALVGQTRQAITDAHAVSAADSNALESGIRLHLALKQTAQAQGLDAFAAECWTGLPAALGLNPCLGFVEDAYTLACEGDAVLSISLLIVRYLSGVRAYVGDLYDVDLAGRVTLIHCGGPASLAAQRTDIVLGRSQLAQQRGFETITCRPRLPTGPVTLFRFYGPACDRMHLALGELVSSEQTPNLAATIQLAGDRWDFLGQSFGNHYVVAPGDLRPELALLARWLSIQVSET